MDELQEYFKEDREGLLDLSNRYKILTNNNAIADQKKVEELDNFLLLEKLNIAYDLGRLPADITDCNLDLIDKCMDSLKTETLQSIKKIINALDEVLIAAFFTNAGSIK